MKLKKICNIILIIILIIIFYMLFFQKFETNKYEENVIKDITFKELEDKDTPLNYKKVYTFVISKLNKKNNSLNFNVENHYVEVFINNKLVYEEKTNIKNKVSIPLDNKDINKEVKIILIPIDKNDINNDLELDIK